ncbi:hypothetical protein SLITO_v1c09610 [Spiroplasma litorale]|uniref:Uncharacterized protein n=1 Tax=Spiroplasma litorale TaxID=216942 RepID=A0A0K1W387_9MOLU|nr:hypothetical protein [Spiroplasma litorale]AKX34572.1 hypothetical protein SLITO_v1c09610 [Spiroplasma litorale]
MKGLLTKITFIALIINTFIGVFFSTFKSHNDYNSVKFNELTQTGYLEQKSVKKEDFLWGGKILQYYLYKHTEFDEYADKLFYMFDKNVKKNKEAFLMSLSSNVIVPSIESLNSYQSFFSEAFLKWSTALDGQKNISWEILNYFFTNIFSTLKKELSGLVNFNRAKRLIDDDFIKNSYSSKLLYSFSFKFSEGDIKLKYSDMLYNSDKFGISDSENYDYPYAQNALINSTYISKNNGDLNSKNNPVISKSLANNYINNIFCKGLENKCVNYEEISKWNNNYYLKASSESIEKYRKFIEEDSLYKSFEELDEKYKEFTFNNRKYPGANITLQLSLDEMAKHYSWTEEKKDLYKNHVLNLFNIIFKILGYKDKDNMFMYALLGFIISPDSSLKITNSGSKDVIKSFTSISHLKSRFNSSYESTGYSFVIFSGDYIGNFENDSDNEDFKNMISSSSNIFSPINKEIGKTLDAFLGRTNEGEKYLEKQFKEALFKLNNAAIYKGSIFGWNEHSNEAADSLTKGILLALYLFLAFVCTVVSIVLLSILIVYFIKKNKNKDKLFKK